MAPDLELRQPERGLPQAVRVAAARAGRRRGTADPLLLARVRDALGRLIRPPSPRMSVEARRHDDDG
jgi:hypothetical protein